MVEADRCELHDVAIVIGTDQSESLLRLGHSPLGDECQHCQVCRSAREYIQRRLDERSGRTLPAGENAEAAWKKLRAAVEHARTSIRHAP